MGSIVNVTSLGLRALVASQTLAPQEPNLLISMPDQCIYDWPVPFRTDTIGTYYPYPLMITDEALHTRRYPQPLCALNKLRVELKCGSGIAVDPNIPENKVIMLLEVDHQPIPAASVPTAVGSPPPQVLTVDSRKAAYWGPIAAALNFRVYLDQSQVKSATRLTLRHVSMPYYGWASTLVRIDIDNLGIRWSLPYSGGGISPMETPTNNLVVLPDYHTVTFASGASFNLLDVAVFIPDPQDQQKWVPMPYDQTSGPPVLIVLEAH